MTSNVNNMSALTIYDFATRATRGAITAYLASNLTKICLNTMQTLPDIKWSNDLSRNFSNVAIISSYALVTGWLAYKCAMRVIKEARGILLEMEMMPLLNDISKNDSILFLQAKADWSGDATCLTRTSFKLL